MTVLQPGLVRLGDVQPTGGRLGRSHSPRAFASSEGRVRLPSVHVRAMISFRRQSLRTASLKLDVSQALIVVRSGAIPQDILERCDCGLVGGR